MPSTTTTKKPNEGPCAACNKEGAVLRCAPCRDAGVDVFFCNRECQVKLWKTHKAVCKKTSTTDSSKEQSSANKETKAEGKKQFQLRKYTQYCSNCKKTEADIGSKLSGCSKCTSAYYCSRECQVEDWPKHKDQCKHNCEFIENVERSFDSSGKNTRHLLQKWLAKTRTLNYFSEAVYVAVKKKGIEQQPPLEAVRMEIEFDYNAQTFVVAEVPRAVAIADLQQKDKEMIRKTLEEMTAEKKDYGYIHFVVISTKELGKRFESYITVGITTSVLDQMGAHVDMFQLRYLYAQNHLKSNLFRGWKSIQRNNLRKQIEQMNLGQFYNVFVHNALQLFCKKSLQNTHRIVVYMKMGQDIGQISRLLHYGIVSITEFKECKKRLEKLVIHVEDTESRPNSYNEMAIETLFVDFETCFGFDHSVLCGVNATQNKTAKQCKKAADKHFRKLQQSVKEMPTDLLEKGEDRDGASSGDYEKDIFEQACKLLTCRDSLEESLQEVFDHFTNTGSNLNETTIYWRCAEFGKKEYISERIRNAWINFYKSKRSNRGNSNARGLTAQQQASYTNSFEGLLSKAEEKWNEKPDDVDRVEFKIFVELSDKDDKEKKKAMSQNSELNQPELKLEGHLQLPYKFETLRRKVKTDNTSENFDLQLVQHEHGQKKDRPL